LLFLLSAAAYLMADTSKEQVFDLWSMAILGSVLAGYWLRMGVQRLSQ
jgi:hypothetical protein